MINAMEMPSITKTAYTASSNTGELAGWLDVAGAAAFNQAQARRPTLTTTETTFASLAEKHTPKTTERVAMQNRIVKVFIVDKDQNLPLEKRLLYSGPEKFTDLTDQELFFEVPIAELLKAHNEKRAEVRDRKASEKFGRDVWLEPVRISQLAMAVVDVATFS